MRDIIIESIFDGTLHFMHSLAAVAEDRKFESCKVVISFFLGIMAKPNVALVERFVQHIPPNLKIHCLVLFAVNQIVDIEVIFEISLFCYARFNVLKF